MDNLTFLVVDDSAFMRKVVKDMLMENGYDKIFEASNGVQAVEKAAQVKPDIVTMDITMPDMDGIQAVKELLKVSPKSNIIMCSALGQRNMVLEAIRSGAKEYVVKPFEKSRLMEAIQRVMYS
ncbi:response regulator [Mahella australiensis]|uniref:Stage 0 sporulation protein A homolog n=1 Tax=Mahella australiensis (strain DSM 15567 / CIP 107919 / 50-1 BON) TaxID=697281 RepID=F4A237_MAHA5|nr:response regulator [Mahella australiensis]AEE97176.1 response regulator receiver protein [Mahella australiensis 50-1 BON]